MRLHGMSRDAWKRYSGGGSWYYEIEDAGYKYNLTDLAAAIGLVQLDRAEAMRDERERVARRYGQAVEAAGDRRAGGAAAHARPGRGARLAPLSAEAEPGPRSRDPGRDDRPAR